MAKKSNYKNNKNKIAKRKFIPWGRTLSTYDYYLPGSSTGSNKERPVVVVDVNNDDLAVVPLSSRPGKNRTHLKNYQQGKSYYKHFIETNDNDGRPIRVNNKFRQNHENMDVARKDVLDMRQKLLNDVRTKERNRNKLEKFKNRYKT